MSDSRRECTAGSRPGLVGDPIDVVTGAVLDRVADFRVAGEPQPFVWRRSYDSTRSDTDRGLGWGHAHELDHSLAWDLDGVLYRRPHEPPVGFPHAFSDGVVGAAEGLELERLDAERFVVRGHGEPARHFHRTRGTSIARLTRIESGAGGIDLSYDRLGQLTTVVLASRRRLRLDWERGHLVQVLLLDASSGPKALVRYRYDERGCLVEGRDAYQQVFRLAYDAERRVVRSVDRRGYAFSFEYDREGRCVRSSGEDGVLEVRLDHRPAECATVVRESSGGEWLYQYEPGGALLQVVDPFGGVRFWERDAAGRIVAEVDPTGATTRYEHDARGATVARIEPSGRRVPLPDSEDAPPQDGHRVPACALQWELGDLEPVGFAAEATFPAITWLAEERALLRTPATEPALAPVHERRDEQGLLLAQQRSDGASRTWAYDPNGNVRRYTDFEGRSYQSEHASWNHRVLEADPIGRATRYAYTKAEKLASLIDPGGTLSEYRYDAKDRLVEVRRAGATRDLYAYDLSDRLVEKRDAHGRVLIELAYERTGLLAERRLATGDVQRFRYDSHGRYRALENEAGAVAFEHDAWGHRTADRRDGLGVEHRYVGDRLIHTRVLGRFDVRYEHHADGSRRIVDPTGATHTLRRVAPGVFRRELADRTTELAQYAPDGRCLAKSVTAADGARWSREYAYSLEGDLLAARDSARGTTYYEHDAAHQIASVRRENEEPLRYTYDAAGNLLEKPGLRGVTLAPGNRLYAANGDAFEYDVRQNLAVRRGPDGVPTRFHHDARDQLVRIDLPDGSTWHAEYDTLGRRARKRHVQGEHAQETTYWWDTDRLAAERLPDGRVRVYVYADDFSMVPVLFVEYADLESAPESGRRYYLFTDHQGTPELVRDQDGEPVWWARREPYGVIVEGGDDFHQPFRFPGHFWDPETRLHYNRFRYYSPELGRYLESDPWGVAGGINTHAYTENPLRQVDVRGLSCDDRPTAAQAPEDRPAAESPTPRPATRAGIADPESARRLTAAPGAHTLPRHGGSVTDEQLQTRARTGVAPDGHVKLKPNGQVILPPHATAFHSDEMAALADRRIRDSGALQAAIDANPGESTVPVPATDIGEDVGRGFSRIGSSTYDPDRQGPLQMHPSIRHVRGVYEKDPATGEWLPITLYPDPQ